GHRGGPRNQLGKHGANLRQGLLVEHFGDHDHPVAPVGLDHFIGNHADFSYPFFFPCLPLLFPSMLALPYRMLALTLMMLALTFWIGKPESGKFAGMSSEMTETDPHPEEIAPTLSAVAKRAGVSSITVSRVLRTPDRVAPETRGRIEKVMRELA